MIISQRKNRSSKRFFENLSFGLTCNVWEKPYLNMDNERKETKSKGQWAYYNLKLYRRDPSTSDAFSVDKNLVPNTSALIIATALGDGDVDLYINKGY